MNVRRWGLFCVLVAMSSLPAAADELSDKQKAAAVKNLKSAGLSNVTTVESANFIVCVSLPEAKAKAIAESLEKVSVTAKKALQFEPNEEPWKGKLTVYIFDDRRPFQMFMLQVAKQRSSDPYHISVRSDVPFIARGIEVGKKPTDAETTADAGKLVAGALLGTKAGATTPLPEWIRFGFGRAVVARAAGQGSRPLNDLKAKAKAAVTARPPAQAEDAWASGNEIVDTSLMDYLAFGPTAAANFPKFLTALRPSEDGDAPSMDQVLMTMTWTKEDLDKVWKKYVITGK